MTKRHEAVNRILRAVGKYDEATESGFTASDGDATTTEGATGSSFASYAERFLNACDKETQAVGWSWNTEHNRTLEPNAQKLIAVPVPIARPGTTDKVLSVDGTAEDKYLHVDVKYNTLAGSLGPHLFDLENNTFLWERSIKVKLIYQLQFNLLPETFVSYLVAKSALELNLAYGINEGVTSLLANQVQMCDAKMRRTNIEQSDINVLETNEAEAIRGYRRRDRRRI